jgi:hypothetical protein
MENAAIEVHETGHIDDQGIVVIEYDALAVIILQYGLHREIIALQNKLFTVRSTPYRDINLVIPWIENVILPIVRCLNYIDVKIVMPYYETQQIPIPSKDQIYESWLNLMECQENLSKVILDIINCLQDNNRTQFLQIMEEYCNMLLDYFERKKEHWPNMIRTGGEVSLLRVPYCYINLSLMLETLCNSRETNT